MLYNIQRCVPIDSRLSKFYQRGFTTYSALTIQSHQPHTNQHHLLLRRRHQMSWTPPSKSPLFTFTGTAVSSGEKSQKSLKCFSGLQCGCPSDTFSRCCLNRTHSQLIVRADERSDRDPKRANRRCWQTYITAQHWAVNLLKQETNWPHVHHDAGEKTGPSTQISFSWWENCLKKKTTWKVWNTSCQLLLWF